MVLQSRGRILRPGINAPEAYAGYGNKANNPAFAGDPDGGELAAGDYDVGPPTPTVAKQKGQPTWGLSQNGKNPRGYNIHGDNGLNNHTGSSGCIVLNGADRAHCYITAISFT